MGVVELPPSWDLSDLFTGLDDPRLKTVLPEILKQAQAFEERYRGKIQCSQVTSELLLSALRAYEEINRERTKPLAFAGLMFQADTTDPVRGALMQRLQEESTAISRHLIFFDLEIGRMDAGVFDRMAADPLLQGYRHYLLHEREISSHYLDEPEEKIVAELRNTGSGAFCRLFSEVTSRMRFRVEREGGSEELTQSQVLSLLYDPNRSVREAACRAVTETLRANTHVLTFIYNTLLQDKATSDRLRKYEYAEQSRHQDNQLSKEVVDNLVSVCAENFGVVADYYRLKRKLLGLEKLTHADRYAPLEEVKLEIPYSEARRTVLEAFERFSPRVREMTEEFFENNWIDAALRPGKRGGAFCSSITPDLHPYVFMNYTGNARDVMTLAHELGHGLHGMLSRKQHYLDFYPSLAMAETASVFAEMLVFEKLQSRLSSPRDRLILLAGKIEDTFATVFRQVAMYRFELAAHHARRTEGELTADRYSALWQENIQAMFRDSLELGEDHACWWSYIPHIYQSPFYVYAYAFGELMVLALYARYQQEGPSFVDRYLSVLEAGGSQKPEDMLKAVGIDIRDRSFWQGGVDLIAALVAQATALAEEANGV